MVKQYGNWMYTNSDPTNDEEVKQLLTDDMNLFAQETGIDFSNGKAEYIFQKMPDDLLIAVDLDTTKEWWSAAWKVTI